MVDFNNDVTVGTPAIDVVRILWLQRRSEVIDHLELYTKRDAQGVTGDLSGVRSKLFSLFLEVQPCLERRVLPEELKALDCAEFNALRVKFRQAKTEEELLDLFYLINHQFDDLLLTRLDTKKRHDRTRWEIDNKAGGQ